MGGRSGMLVVLDEFTRAVPGHHCRRDDCDQMTVLHCLADLFAQHGPPEHIRSDNGPEFVATAVRGVAGPDGRQDALHEPGSPWENGYCESLNSKLRDSS